MAAKKKGAGGSLTRSQVVTVRLDPKLKFAAELAARKQRRTISSFIEWAIERAVSSELIYEPTSMNDEGVSFIEAVTTVWDVDDADRFVKLSLNYPELLNYEEERIWKLIKDTPFFFKLVERQHDPNSHLTWSLRQDNIWFDRVREHWELLNKIIAGEESTDNLPELPKNEIKDSQVPF